MQNIPQDDEGVNNIPITQPAKTINKIINNRYLNQNIYSMLLQNRYDECIKLIDRCQPDEFKLYTKSLAYKNSYKLEKSLELLNQCHIMNRLNCGYLKSIAKNYYLLGKYKSSLEVAKDVEKLNDRDHEISYIFGKIYLAMGNKKEAINRFRAVIAKEVSEQAYLQQVKIHMSDLQYQQAIDLLKQCLNFSVQNPEIYETMGNCLMKVGRVQEACRYFQQALERDADRYNSLIGLSCIAQERGETDEALQIFKKAYKTSMNSAVLWNNIGITMFGKKKLIAAYSCFKRALFLDPFRWDIHTNLGLIFIAKGKFLQAQIHIRTALKYNKDGTLYNLLAMCLCELKDFSNAEKALQQALKMQNTNEQFQFNLFVCLLKKGQNQKAKKIHTQLTRRSNNSQVRAKLIEYQDRL